MGWEHIFKLLSHQCKIVQNSEYLNTKHVFLNHPNPMGPIIGSEVNENTASSTQ